MIRPILLTFVCGLVIAQTPPQAPPVIPKAPEPSGPNPGPTSGASEVTSGASGATRRAPPKLYQFEPVSSPYFAWYPVRARPLFWRILHDGFRNLTWVVMTPPQAPTRWGNPMRRHQWQRISLIADSTAAAVPPSTRPPGSPWRSAGWSPKSGTWSSAGTTPSPISTASGAPTKSVTPLTARPAARSASAP